MMYKFFLLTLFLFLLTVNNFAISGSKIKEEDIQNKISKCSIIIKLTSKANIDEYLDSIEKKYNSKVFLISKELRLYKVNFPKSLDKKVLLDILSKDEYIEYAEDDKPMKIRGK